MSPGRLASRAEEERGGVLVLFAVVLPVLILLASFVIDMGNWFEHRRHLQMQADAAALAAAADFPAADLSTCSDAKIDDTVRTYGGLKPPGPGTFNQQVGDTALEDVLYKVNSPIWPSQPEDVDPTAPEGTPCETGVVDVKLAEQKLPWFFKVAQVGFINAHARVQIQRAGRMRGAMPLGVPDTNPKAAQVFFVDEAKTPGTAGYVLAATKLCRTGSADGQPLWGNAGVCSKADEVSPGPLPVGITVRDIGVRVVLSGKALADCDPSALESCYAAVCADSDPLTACYAAGSNRGLVHIRGWSDEPGSSTSPRAKDVQLKDGTCPDGYFVHPKDLEDLEPPATSCAVDVHAKVDFGTKTNPDGTKTPLGPELGAKVTANGNELAYNATEDLWTSDTSARVPVIPGDGPVDVELKWSITKNADGTTCTTGCSGTFGQVQRSFAATTEKSGPIRGVTVAEGIMEGANSFRRCGDPDCVHSLSVTVRLQPSLHDLPNSPTDPPVDLRLSGSGSLTQALDCDDVPQEPDDHPEANDSLLKSEVAFGCSPEYQINDGDPCPAQGALWGTAQPWDCVKTEQGAKVNDIVRGLNRRINGSFTATTCLNEDRWAEYMADGKATQDELANDPRTIALFLTPFGAFDDSGQSVFPITGFAAFYVRGYEGQGGGNTDPCWDPDDPKAEPGAAIGHFVQYLDLINNGEGSGEACSFDGLEICVPVLTR